MAVAILTRYLGPTDHRGSRVKAYTETGLSKMFHWDDGLSVEANHRAAAEAFAKEKRWAGTWVGGGTKEGYAWVHAARAGAAYFSVRSAEMSSHG